MRIFRTFLVALFGAVLVSIGAAFGSAPAPFITPLVVDLGRCAEPTTATFVVHNPTPTPLVITRVEATCGCTKIRHQRSPIMPLDSTALTVRYSPAADSPGHFYKTIRIHTSHPDSEPLQAIIKGKNTTN